MHRGRGPFGLAPGVSEGAQTKVGWQGREGMRGVVLQLLRRSPQAGRQVRRQQQQQQQRQQKQKKQYTRRPGRQPTKFCSDPVGLGRGVVVGLAAIFVSASGVLPCPGLPCALKRPTYQP